MDHSQSIPSPEVGIHQLIELVVILFADLCEKLLLN